MPRERSRIRHRAALALLAATATLLCFYAVLADPVDEQQRALREHLTPKRSAADCAHVLRLTPEEAATLGWFHYHRALMDCKDVDALLNDDVKTPLGKDKDKTHNTIDTEFKNTITGREGWKPTTPDEIKAHATAEARNKKLAADKAELDAKQAALAKQQAETEAMVKANEVKRKEYLAQLQKESDARAAEAQKLRDARNQAELDRAQKVNDDIRAAQDAKTREQFAAAEKADLERQNANRDARASENELLAKDKAQRDADKLQQEADERQAEADKLSANEEQKAKNAAQRQKNAETRTANEQARQQREAEFRANEEARFAREREAEAAKLKREKTEAEIKKEEEARAQRAKNLEENEKALAAREKEFAEVDAAREKRLKKMKEDEDARAAEERKRRDADRDKADEINGKKKDLDKQDEDIPHEEKPKRDDEDDCDSSSGDKATCHNGGKCFQLRADPSKKRCKCETGYKGEKCEFESCSATGADKKVKTGNKVDGKCVRWDSEYNCPGCNKNWNLVVHCVEIGPTGIEKNVSSHDCSKMRKPENKFEDEVCKYCLNGCGIKNRPRRLRQEATTRQLLPDTTGFEYKLAPAGCDRDSYPAGTFVYSTVPHRFREGTTKAVVGKVMQGTTKEGCLDECWKARGYLKNREKYYNGRYPMGKHHCTWVTWTGETCRLYFQGDLPYPDSHRYPMRHAQMIAFISFPRRFEISRENKCDSERTFEVRDGHSVATYVVCIGDGKYEGTGTFCRGLGPDRKCAATYMTMVDAALHFEDLSRRDGGGRNTVLEFMLPVPEDLKHIHGRSRSVIGVTSGSSGQPWTYTFDALGRVTSVSAIQKLPVSNLNTDGRELVSPSAYQKIFNYEMQYGKVGRVFQAGHLVAAAQKPPNFFFNYVPQHGNSNSNGGCWWFTEIAASDFQRMGCEISYDIALTYPVEGDTPQDTGGTIPDWVAEDERKKARENAYDLPEGSNAFRTQCHFRYRPVTMGLTFRIKDSEGGTTCRNLVDSGDPSWNNGPLVQVHWDIGGRVTLTTSRVNAYLIQKWTIGKELKFDRGPPKTRTLGVFKKLYSVATAMENNLPGVKCYAETGGFFPFDKITFTPDFRRAFITTQQNEWCLTTNGQGFAFTRDTSSCTKWTYNTGSGVITPNGYGNCAVYDSTCAKFVYYRDPRDPAIVPTLPIREQIEIVTKENAPATQTPMSLEDLVGGTIEVGDRCLFGVQDGAVVRTVFNPTGGAEKKDCVKLRISYYPLRLSEGNNVDKDENDPTAAPDEDEVKDFDGDGDDDGDVIMDSQ